MGENMTFKLILDSNKIFHKTFEGNKPGYDALQVDTFLDIVIKDYDTFQNYVTYTTQEIEDMKTKVDMLNKQLSQVEAENASLKAKLGDVSSNEDASYNNLELLKRISSLEKALSKVGINPSTIE